MQAYLLDDFKVEIDERSAKIGGCWQGKLRNGIPTAWGDDVLRFFYKITLQYEQPTILDVGANTGSFSLLAAMNPKMRSYAFEPMPSICGLLCNNIFLNGLQNRIKPFQIALADRNGKAVLKYPKAGNHSGLACLGNPIRFKEWTEHQVECRRLDDFAAENGINAADIIKIDTEGCELFILRGAEEFIRKHKPAIFCEYYEPNARQFGYDPIEIVKLLSSWGYHHRQIGVEDIYFYLPAKTQILKPSFTNGCQPVRIENERQTSGDSLARAKNMAFDEPLAMEINKARMEHLASLGLDIAGKSVLEVGAGVGWLTGFFEKLGCKTLSTDARQSNIEEHRRRYPHRAVEVADLTIPGSHDKFGEFDIVFCYGTLYHLADPGLAIKDLAGLCKDMFLLETCVYPEDNSDINFAVENINAINQSFQGKGCRPARNWVFSELKKHFPFVYITASQARHPDFQLSWPAKNRKGNCRSVFICSRQPLNNPVLLEQLPDTQYYHNGAVNSVILSDNRGDLRTEQIKTGQNPDSKEPYISVVVASRNDDYDSNMLHRMQVFTSGLAAQCKRFNLDAELIVVEWNPPAGKKRLYEVLEWPDDLGHLTVRFIEVPAEIHNSIGNSDKIPFFQMTAKNVGIRRARGKFVLATNIDILFSDEMMQFLAGRQLDENCFYRVDRYDVGCKTIPTEISIEEQLKFCRDNVVRINTLDGTKNISEFEQGRADYSAAQTKLHTNACGDFTLMAREKWHLLKGYPEIPLWSIYVDGVLLHMVQASGWRQVILSDPMRIYHIEHDTTWACYNKDKREQATRIYPSLDYQKDYFPWCRRMIEEKRPISDNDENWGYAADRFREDVINGQQKKQNSNAQAITQDDNYQIFQQWIDKLASAQNRLYYRDQTPESLKQLVEIVHRYNPTKIVELGTLSGLSLRTWLLADNDVKVIAIDISFKTLYETQQFLPVDLSRVKLVEQNILKVDFRSLWTPGDRILLYVDAHDLPNVPIMKYVLENAVPSLPPGSIIAVDDLWYSAETLSGNNAHLFFRNHVLNQADRLQCFDGCYAPYWEGGSFMGFQEVVPFLHWVNRNRIKLNFNPEVKSVFIEWSGDLTPAQDFNEQAFCSACGNITYNPLKNLQISENRQDQHLPADDIFENAANLYKTGKIKEALESLCEIHRRNPDASGVLYGMAICEARMGHIETAKMLLEKELSLPNHNLNAATLLKDIQSHQAGNDKKRPGLTIFAIPKSFEGQTGIIQRNAIKSWTLLEPRPEIILFGNDKGVAEIAKGFEVRHIQDVKRNKCGTPLVNDLFEKAQSAASNNILVYINSDIVLMSDFMPAVQRAASRFEEFLMIGRRWDVNIDELLDFENKKWEDELRACVVVDGYLHGYYGIDYFAFTRGLWPAIPDFGIGRTAWDNWLVGSPIEQGKSVVDATEAVMIIHQDHGYTPLPHRDGEVIANREMAGTLIPWGCISNAIWKFDREDIILRHVGEFFQNQDLLKAFEYIDRAYQQKPDIVKRQCEHFVNSAVPDMLTKLANAAKKVLDSKPENNIAKLVSEFIEVKRCKDVEDLFKKGVGFLRDGNAQEAMRYFSFVSAKQEMANLHFAIATAYVQLGKLYSAKKECEEELKLQPGHKGVKELFERIEGAINEYERIKSVP